MPIVSLDHHDDARVRGTLEHLIAAALDGRGRVLIGDARILLGSGHMTDAFLIGGDRILAVGRAARAEGARIAAAGAALRELALPGLTIAPGFIDAHTHLVHMGLGLSRLDLAGAGSAALVIEQVREALAGHDPSRPFIAEHWDDSGWAAGDRLVRADLDRLTQVTPVVLRRVCGHKAVANSAALAMIARHPEAAASDGVDGQIDAVTGTLVEDAAMRLGEAFPPSAAEVSDALDTALAHAAGLGVTGAHDIVNSAALRAHQAHRRAGRLTLRLTVHTGIENLDALDRVGLTSGLGDEWLKLGGIKLFLDGSLGSRTAALAQPYADRPGETGLLRIDPAKLADLLGRIDALGLTAVIHAIGDRAIATALAALESLGPGAVGARRHRIEHCELTPNDLVERLARSGATASMQPNFVARWGAPGGMYGAALGNERRRQMNRFRSLAERGVPLAFGSDCMPMGPLAGMSGAVNHPVDEERLTGSEALAAYTCGSARAGFAESQTGAIEEGKLADFVVLDGDPLGTASSESCRVMATVVGGRCVYSARPPLHAGAESS